MTSLEQIEGICDYCIYQITKTKTLTEREKGNIEALRWIQDYISKEVEG